MSYHNFAQLFPANQAQDRVRGSKIPSANTELSTLEEAFTSENWMVSTPFAGAWHHAVLRPFKEFC